MRKTVFNNNREENHGFFDISRRTFLKLSALVVAAIGITSLFRRPAAGSLFTSNNEKYDSIAEQWLATSCLNCPTRCATKVRIVDGKAVKITGNPLSQVSEGKTCPRAHIGLQVLYDKARVTTPLKRTNPSKGRGVDPGWVPVSWGEALGEVSKRLQSLREADRTNRLLLLQGLNTISDEDVIRRFAEAFGTPNVISSESLENEAEKAGQWLSDGNYVHSAYDLDNTNYILAFGASILESHKPVARHLRKWGRIRRERPNRAKVVVIDPRYSVTASKADRWLPINPGTDGALALAIASVIISENLYDAAFVDTWTSGFREYKDLVTNHYKPEVAAGITGISADDIREIAVGFARTKPAIAWRGRGATSWPHGSYASYAIFCLNALVGSIDAPGGVTYQQYPKYRELPKITEDTISRNGKAQPRLDLTKTEAFPAAEAAVNQVADSVISGKPYPVELAIGFNSDFNMSAPGTARWDEALARIPYYIHMSPFTGEMADYADILLPTPTFLEEWGYDHCPPGSGFAELKIKQPVVKPLHDTKGIIDIIFNLAGRMGGAVASSFAGIGGDAAGFVRYRTENIIPWDKFRSEGVWVEPSYDYYKYDRIFKTPSKKFEFRSGNLEALLQGKGQELDYLPHYKEAKFLGNGSNYPLVLTRYQPLLTVENGSQNYPWAQEVFLVMHGAGWKNFVEINSKTAQSLGVRDGDAIWIESAYCRLKAGARVFDGIHPGVVAIAYGQGHYAGGQWQRSIGINPNDIIGVDYDRLSGQSSLYNTRVRVYRA